MTRTQVALHAPCPVKKAPECLRARDICAVRTYVERDFSHPEAIGNDRCRQGIRVPVGVAHQCAALRGGRYRRSKKLASASAIASKSRVPKPAPLRSQST